MQLDSIKSRIEKSIARARKLKTDKLHNNFSQKIKLAKAQETKHKLDLEEDKKAQQILGNLNTTVEYSRVIFT